VVCARVCGTGSPMPERGLSFDSKTWNLPRSQLAVTPHHVFPALAPSKTVDLTVTAQHTRGALPRDPAIMRSYLESGRATDAVKVRKLSRLL